jgi:hypothetical protein
LVPAVAEEEANAPLTQEMEQLADLQRVVVAEEQTLDPDHPVLEAKVAMA